MLKDVALVETRKTALGAQVQVILRHRAPPPPIVEALSIDLAKVYVSVGRNALWRSGG